jgi:hypothetical protein
MLQGIITRAANGRPLSAGQLDGNWQAISDFLDEMQGGVTITGITMLEDGSGFYLVLSNGDSAGPILFPEIPVPEPVESFPEAPLDGEQYARRDGDWSIVVGEVEEAPDDTKLYGRVGKNWAEIVVKEAPKNGTPYVRQDGSWITMPSSGGGGSTPAGTFRIRGDWTSGMVMVKYDVVEHNSMLWMCRDNYGANTPAPSVANDGYWRPISFPTTVLYEGVTDALYHQWATATKTSLQDLWTILNTFENVNVAQNTKIAALEAKDVTLTNRIKALEDRLAAASIA